MPSLNRLQAFDAYLRSNAIPIDGLSGSLPYGPTTVTIQYASGATVEQVAWAEQAKQAFDWRPRRFLSDAVIASTFAGLTAQQQNAVLRRLLVRVMKSDEVALLQLLSDLGVSLPYDEVGTDPN